MIPSAEIIEPLHSRARIAREVLKLLHEPLDIRQASPSCARPSEPASALEAFGRPPARLLAELRLNAARRALRHPSEGTSVTAATAQYGFAHFGATECEKPRNLTADRRPFVSTPGPQVGTSALRFVGPASFTLVHENAACQMATDRSSDAGSEPIAPRRVNGMPRSRFRPVAGEAQASYPIPSLRR